MLTKVDTNIVNVSELPIQMLLFFGAPPRIIKDPVTQQSYALTFRALVGIHAKFVTAWNESSVIVCFAHKSNLNSRRAYIKHADRYEALKEAVKSLIEANEDMHSYLRRFSTEKVYVRIN